MRQQNFEAPPLFPPVCLLIRPKLFDQTFFIRISGCCSRRILESNCDSVVPSRIFGHVVRRSLDLYRHDASAFSDLLEQRIVVLQKQLQKFLLATPLHLVVVLDRIRLTGGALRWRPLSEQRWRKQEKRQSKQQTFHQNP